MTDDLADDLTGQRATATIEGEERLGTITSVTYTPKKGDLVVAFSLDEPTPSGKSSVPVAFEDIEPLRGD